MRAEIHPTQHTHHTNESTMLSLPPLAPNYPYAFPPPSSTKRANTLLIKHALVDLLPVEIGELYWSLLTKLVTGRITKNEFELGWSSMRQLSESNNNIANDVEADDLFERLEILHNSFLLSILYNTTKTTLPPASVSHQGWTSKRKRGEAGLLAEGGSDPLGILNKKRRKLKKLTAGMTKSEKKRLKALLGVNASSNEKEKALVPNSKPGQGLQQQQQRPGLLMPPSAGLKTPSSGESCFVSIVHTPCLNVDVMPFQLPSNKSINAYQRCRACMTVKRSTMSIACEIEWLV